MTRLFAGRLDVSISNFLDVHRGDENSKPFNAEGTMGRNMKLWHEMSQETAAGQAPSSIVTEFLAVVAKATQEYELFCSEQASGRKVTIYLIVYFRFSFFVPLKVLVI